MIGAASYHICANVESLLRQRHALKVVDEFRQV